MSFKYQSLLGDASIDADAVITSELDADTANISSLKVTTTSSGVLTTNTLKLPTNAALNNVLTCVNLNGTAAWRPPVDVNLAGDAVGIAGGNRVDTLAGGTILVSNLVTLAGSQTLTNKTLDTFNATGNMNIVNNGGIICGTWGARKRFVIYERGNASSRDDHQFDGIGKGISETVYQLGAGGLSHTFYSALTATTSLELMRIRSDGSVSIPGSLTIPTISSSSTSGLVLSSTGTTYGSSKVIIQNIGGCNGMLLDTTGASVALTDIVCKSGTKSMNMRFESRTASLLNAANDTYGEYQVLLNNSLSAAAYFGTAACGIAGTINANAINCTGLKLTGGALGNVLTSDASGNASWTPPAVVTSVGNLTMSGYLFNPEGRYLLANKPASSSLFLGEGGNSTANGLSNVICGPSAYNMTSAAYTTAVGTSSMPNLTTGFYSTAVGYQTLPTLTTGQSNTAIGVDAGRGITDGSNNTFLGTSTNATVGSITGSTALGSGAFLTTSNTVQLGGSNVTNVYTSGTINGPALKVTTAEAVNYNSGGYRAPTVQGTYLTWNRSGASGTATWGNQKGGGVGGHEWVEYDIGTATTTVGMSLAGNQLTLGGVNFPKNGAFGNTLKYYEEYAHVIAFLGPVTTDLYQLQITQIGRLVTLYMPNGPGYVATTGGVLGWGIGINVLPVRFRPISNVNAVLVGKNNGATTLLNVLVDSLGGVTLSVALTSTTWVGNIGFNTFSLSWSIGF